MSRIKPRAASLPVRATVSRGDPLVVLEAMKMETEIRSSTAGVVQTMHVDEGESVNAGDVLVTLE